MNFDEYHPYDFGKPDPNAPLDELALHALAESTAKEVKRYQPFLLRALLAAPPIISPEQLDSVPGERILLHRKDGEQQHGWYSKERCPEVSLDRDSRKKGWVTLELSQQLFDDLAKSGRWTDGTTELNSVLFSVMELDLKDVEYGSILPRDSGERTGYAIRIKGGAYRAMAKDALEYFTHPRNTAAALGITNPALYQDALKSEQSELYKMVKNLVLNAGLEKKEATALIASATKESNFEFAAIIQKHMHDMDKRLGRRNDPRSP